MAFPLRHRWTGRGAFTLVEVLAVMAVLGIVVALLVPTFGRAIHAGQAAKSSANLRQLVLANQSYAAENDGYYCPAQDRKNRVRWHGGRSGSTGGFDPAKGYLAPYLGASRQVGICPLFQALRKSEETFEEGTGGYGYNATYIGGTPASPYQPIMSGRVSHPARTLMFATTAFARGEGVQEYPYAEPPQWVDPNGQAGGELQASIHFRAEGKALVGWCDGHVTAELPNQLGGTEYYGGDSVKQKIGWFGPTRDNGYLNPDFEP